MSKDQVLEFPVRLPNHSRKMTIILPAHEGMDAKIYLRDIAKKMDEYNHPIKLNGNISGQNDKGEKIPISSVGRWLFGVPGYKGHIIVDNMAPGNACKIEWPSGSPEIVNKLIENLKKKVEEIES